MILTIEHETCYQYLDQVFLEPHVLRLTPRQDRTLRIYKTSLQIEPEPQGMNQILENDGTQAHLVWFRGMTKVFRVQARAEVELQPVNPFDFIIYPSAGMRLPLVYPPGWEQALAAYVSSPPVDPDVKTFAFGLAEEAGQQTVPFLTALNKTIHTDFTYEKREHGQPYAPEHTLKAKSGSCRDYVVLALDACRVLGLAARFVSGYYFSEDSEQFSELHAWLEVFLPGAGWKGFDPSHGIVCDQHHIALAASADPSKTLPVSGTFRGFASSRMSTSLAIAVS